MCRRSRRIGIFGQPFWLRCARFNGKNKNVSEPLSPHELLERLQSLQSTASAPRSILVNLCDHCRHKSIGNYLCDKLCVHWFMWKCATGECVRMHVSGWLACVAYTCLMYTRVTTMLVSRHGMEEHFASGEIASEHSTHEHRNGHLLAVRGANVAQRNRDTHHREIN